MADGIGGNGEVHVATQVNVSVSHNCGRIEAKRLLNAGIDATAERWGLVEAWNDNVMTLTGSGTSAGVTSTTTVRNNSVDVVVNLPDVLDSIAGTLESRVRNRLGELLGSSSAA